jgi:hypothetical protein
MMSRTQTIPLLIAIVCILFGVTFVRQYMKSDTGGEGPDGPTSPTGAVNEVRLDFPRLEIEGHPEWEYRLAGHHDFWFQNTYPYPLEIGFEKKSCRCSKVEALPLSSSDADQYLRLLNVTASTMALESPVTFLNTLGVMAVGQKGLLKFEDEHGGWKQIDNEKNVLAPAQGAGFVRLSWDGKQISSVRLTAEVWAQAEGSPHTRGGVSKLEMPVTIVPAFHSWPEKLELGVDLNPNGQQTVETFIWSSTRAGFTISAKEESNNPCFECQCSQVRGDEFDRVSKYLDSRGPTHPLTMYRVRVTVRERIGDKQMDLGPFSRKIILTSDQPDFPKNSVTVEGTVRGDVKVGSVDAEDTGTRKGERDKIVLRVFRSDRGTQQRTPIETSQPGMKLSVDSVIPSYLEADLKLVEQTESGDRWSLTLTVPPNRITGRFPPDSAVILKSNSVPPRRIRIPILGRASLALDTR